jgi:Ca2+-binding RTX toxin-like protein
MPAPTLLTAPFKLFTNASFESEPVVAAGRDGRFVISWEIEDGADADIESRVYQGASFGTGGGGSVAALGDGVANIQRNPDSAILNSGSIVTVSDFEFTAGNSDIALSYWIKNGAGGYTSSFSNISVSAATAGQQFRPEIVALTGGGFVVAWQDQNDTTIKFKLYNANGGETGALGTIPSVASNQVGGTFNFDLTALSSGGFAISSRAATGIGNQSAKFSIFDAGGTAVLLNAEASAEVAGASHGSVCITQLSGGNIAVAWRDADDGGVGYRIFNSAGVALTPDKVIPAVGITVGDVPRLAPTLDNRFMVVFSGGITSGGVQGQMVDAAGNLDGATFAVAAGTSAGQPEIETTADGRIVVTWSQSGDIYAAIYDPRQTGVNVTGTTGVDNYVGGAFNDTLNGSDGDDTLAGGAGNDTIEGSFNADISYGEDGNDKIFAATQASPSGSSVGDTMSGGAGNDTIVGSLGSDILDGGTGVDEMTGGDGADFYSVDNAGDIIIEGAGASSGYDIVTATVNYTLSDNVEQLVILGGATGGTGGGTANYLYGGNSGLSLNLDGGAGDDILYAGLAGGNVLTGGSGVDTLLLYGGNNVANGGLGSDIYFTYTATDTLSEVGGDGIDTVYANWNITLGAGFEQLVLFGAAATAVGSADANIIYGNGTLGAVNLFGLAGADVLFGGASNDALDGGSENDYLFGLGGVNTLVGGAGNDIFYVETAGNTVVENAGEGFDTLYSNAAGITTLAANVEQLILYGASTGGTGTALGDYIYGNASGNALSIEGGDGFDYILGSNQNDTISGGFGNDTLDLRGAGAAGNDSLYYKQVANFGSDYVIGFDSDPTGGQDLIDILGMGYGAVSFGTTIIIGASGADTLVTFQGGNLFGTIIRLQGVAAATVTSADFVF